MLAKFGPRYSNQLTWLLLAILCGISFFWRLGANGIWDLDEALYVESAREMHLSGDYVTPRVNAEPFFEKPPLIYWEAAGLFKLFGSSELPARLPSALASAAVVLLVYIAGKRVFGKRAGVMAAVFYSVCPLVFGTSRQLTTDATLNLCIFGALTSLFLASVRDEASEPERGSLPRRFLPYLFWICCALGVLAKGLPGILIPLVVGLLYYGFVEKWNVRRILNACRRMRPGTGILLFLLIAAPWHVAALRASGPAFTDEYIIRQHLARFRGGDTAHKAPFWFFIPGFFVGFFPLSLFVPGALLDRKSLSDDYGRLDVPNRFRILLKVWFCVVFVMFSAAGSKLISYVLPLYPAAALLAGDWCVQRMESAEGIRSLKKCAGFGLALSTLLLGVLLSRDSVIQYIESISHKPVRLDQIPAGTFEWATHLFLATTLAMAVFLAFLFAKRPNRAFGALAAGMTLFTGIAVVEGLPLLNRSLVEPLQRMATVAGQTAEKDSSPIALYIGPPRRPSTLFYLPDSVMRRKDVGGKSVVKELMDPKDEYGNIDAFLAANPHAVVVTDVHRVTHLLEAGMRVISRAGDWHVLVR